MIPLTGHTPSVAENVRRLRERAGTRYTPGERQTVTALRAAGY